MTEAAALAGWMTAVVTLGVALGAWRALGSRMEAVARACHELRGPITAVRLGLELGSRRGELSPARLRAIDTELGRASLALEDLDSARSRGLHRLELAAVDLRELLEDAVEAGRPAAAAAGKELRWQWTGPGVRMWGDRLRLAQAAGNLIGNAIRHGGGTVLVRGGVDARRLPVRALVEVIDDGAGLPAPVDELARRARKGRGAHGRGLAIAAGIAAAHGGRLAAAPTDRGARLVLELPAVESAPRRRQPPRSSRT
jgi:signal transduction histidine kinase